MEGNSFDKRRFEHIAGKCEVVFCNYQPRSKCGMQKWEIKARYEDGNCKVIVMRDTGFNVSGEIVNVNVFENRDERNIELKRLYFEEGLSQQFLANLFNMSQPAISLIVNKK